uniref:Uncharacterized protein n=1 Tax=Avena sativa TaxID=4498 RepID=A0ACD5V9U3_AVESA
MEVKSQSPLAASAAVSKVLDDDDLLLEIIVRVTFPTSLVRAALVCKRWLWHISDPKFLSRFCKLHPPRLLGFYVNNAALPRYPLCFIPMQPQTPELTAVMRHTSFSLDTGQKAVAYIRDCRNGRICIMFCEGTEVKHGVYNPLFPERGMSIIPPFPCYQRKDDYYSWSHLFSINEGGDLYFLYVLVESNKETGKSVVHVYTLRPGDGVWHIHFTLATDPLFDHWDKKAMLIDNKIYMPGFPSDIVVLDLVASSSSTIRLPPGVDYGDRDNMLSRSDDASGVYLIQTKELQLRIWLHEGDHWLMVDTISLVDMFANLRISDCMGKEEQTAVLRIKRVGDNVEFVFLQMGRHILYLDIKCRTLHKVYELTDKGLGFYFDIYPFKMIWPPTFPLLKDDPSRNAI